MTEQPPGLRPVVFRCFGTGNALYERYHDDEWGVPVRDERGLFERFSLEAFQSGLAWITILRKREAFRAAFAGFDAEVLAGWGAAEVERLLTDAAIVRNRAKIEATLAKARALKAAGFRFVGPTTAYASMQACGIVNDHLAACPVRARLTRR